MIASSFFFASAGFETSEELTLTLLIEDCEPAMILARDTLRFGVFPLILDSIVHFVPVISEGFK